MLSDQRMADNLFRQAAVRAARVERGVVVNHLGAFPVVSEQPLRALSNAGGAYDHFNNINRLCDQAYPSHLRMPADLRFRDANEAMAVGANEDARSTGS